MAANAKDYNKMVKALDKAGWTSRVTKHRTMYCPCGEHRLVFAISAGRGRAMANMRAEIRRTKCEYLPMEFA